MACSLARTAELEVGLNDMMQAKRWGFFFIGLLMLKFLYLPKKG
jgi:hypothetical protein